MKPLKIGLLGAGTVGSGTFSVLARNQKEISGRAGRKIEVAMVAARNVERARHKLGDAVDITSDAMQVVNCPNIDVVVEVIGGCTLAKELVLKAISNGKHVVTANKALLATHGNEIFATAREKGVVVAFEGAVAVSIPIIKVLREGLTGNRIDWVAGIINGTTNFILSEMRDKGMDLGGALKEAQRRGYAEADPTFDIEGVDAAHKISIMAALSFGMPVQFSRVHIEGITKLQTVDFQNAERLGYQIKLLGIAKRVVVNGKDAAELRVHPALIPESRLIANVEGSMNAIMVGSNPAGVTMYYGAGAGSEETASAVIADLVDIARQTRAAPEHRVPCMAFQPGALVNMPIVPMAEVRTGYYLRISVIEGSGALADVMRLLSEASISIAAMLRTGLEEDEVRRDIVILTHQTLERHVDDAISKIEAMPTVVGMVTRIRLECLA